MSPEATPARMKKLPRAIFKRELWGGPPGPRGVPDPVKADQGVGCGRGRQARAPAPQRVPGSAYFQERQLCPRAGRCNPLAEDCARLGTQKPVPVFPKGLLKFAERHSKKSALSLLNRCRSKRVQSGCPRLQCAWKDRCQARETLDRKYHRVPRPVRASGALVSGCKT